MQSFSESGILVVDKPSEWTSHDVVNLIRRRFKVKKVGHCGTLDPAATGVLVIVLGKATKLSQRLSGQDKCYETTLLLGKETDSMDLDGELINEDSNWENLSLDVVKDAVNSFLGLQQQIPPMVSAKKVDGKRLYKLAREGKVVERNPVEINISSIDIKSVSLPTVDFIVSCSKGTYIRSLCSDIGKKLGTCGVLKKLVRLKSGIFNIEQAHNVEEIKTWEQPELSKNLLWLHNLKI